MECRLGDCVLARIYARTHMRARYSVRSLKYLRHNSFFVGTIPGEEVIIQLKAYMKQSMTYMSRGRRLSGSHFVANPLLPIRIVLHYFMRINVKRNGMTY